MTSQRRIICLFISSDSVQLEQRLNEDKVIYGEIYNYVTSTLNEGAFVVGKPFIARRINKV